MIQFIHDYGRVIQFALFVALLPYLCLGIRATIRAWHRSVNL